ncbi:MAG: endonuclease/exonuclease/phosphatase family protein [Methylobacter sp.]|nr:endonuclease/exonuclease/phosphatase family protein [Methylobacter sp.]
MSKNQLRVLTYNIHKGFNIGNRRFVLDQIRDALIYDDADLLFLQEMQGQHNQHEKKVLNWPESSQSEFLADGGWPHYAYGKNAIYNKGHHGNAILSKYPLEFWENINVSPYPWASRSLLHGIVRIPESNKAVHIVCIHFGLMGTERRRQAEILCKRIDSHVPHDAPLIVAGDFNDWMGLIHRHFHDDLELKEVFHVIHGRHARTFPVWMPLLPMDRIYYRGLEPTSCKRLGHLSWRSLSDHIPLSATFQL